MRPVKNHNNFDFRTFRDDFLSFMPKYEDNQSVMNPNLVYFSMTGYLISSYTLFQTACVGNRGEKPGIGWSDTILW